MWRTVSVRMDDPDRRQGGTRRYLPPDIGLSAPTSAEDETDREVHALGITVFECLAGAKYPWDSSTPPAGVEPKRSEDLVPDISLEFSSLIKGPCRHIVSIASNLQRSSSTREGNSECAQ